MDKKNRYCKGYTAWLAHKSQDDWVMIGKTEDGTLLIRNTKTGQVIQSDRLTGDVSDRDRYDEDSARGIRGVDDGSTLFKAKSKGSKPEISTTRKTAYSTPSSTKKFGSTGLPISTDVTNSSNSKGSNSSISPGSNDWEVVSPYNASGSAKVKNKKTGQTSNVGLSNQYTGVPSMDPASRKQYDSPIGPKNMIGPKPWAGSSSSGNQRDSGSGYSYNVRNSMSRPKTTGDTSSGSTVSGKPSSWDPDSSSYRDWKKKYNQSYYQAHKDYWRMYYGVKSPKTLTAPSSATANMYRDEAYKQAAEARSRAQYDRTNYDRRSNAQKMLDRSAADRSPERTTFGKELFNAKTRLNDLWSAGAGSIASAGKSVINKAKANRSSFNDMWANGASTIAKAGKSFLDAWKSGLKR